MSAIARMLRAVEIPAELPAQTPTEALAERLATIRPPGGVQLARRALDASRGARQVAAAELAALINRHQAERNEAGDSAVKHSDVVAAQAAVETAKAEFFSRKAELRAAISEWAPALCRTLAPHRRDPAQRIVDAVNVIEAALAEIAPVDGLLRRWAIEPAPALDMRDLRAMRHSAERIVASV